MSSRVCAYNLQNLPEMEAFSLGSCRWMVHLEDRVHTVDLEHGYWSGKRRVFVDGQLVHVGGGFFLKVWAVGSRDTLMLGNHTCEVLVKPNFQNNSYDYYLASNGQVFHPGEVHLVDPPRG